MNLKSPYENQDNVFQKFAQERAQVCIFTPVSLMNMKDSNGVSLLQYLTFTTEPNCIQDGLLSNEEMAAVALYKSKELHMSYQLDRKDISNLLAVNLQIILVDNSPLQS